MKLFFRWLFISIFLIAAAPWLSGHILAIVKSDFSGDFVEQTLDGKFAPSISSYYYQPPVRLGTWYEVEAPKMGFSNTKSTRTYNSFGPTEGDKRPVIVLLHGAGRNGRSMLDMWKDIAQKENIILLAPNAGPSGDWSLIDDAIFVTETMIEDAKNHYPIDTDRIYLSGHSNGGKFAIRLTNLGIGSWAATHVHAATLWQGTVLPSKSRTPIQSHIGEHDQIFPLNEVKNMAKALVRAGHDLELNIIPNHDHWFYEIGPKISLEAWSFFSRQ